MSLPASSKRRIGMTLGQRHGAPVRSPPRQPGGDPHPPTRAAGHLRAPRVEGRPALRHPQAAPRRRRTGRRGRLGPAPRRPRRRPRRRRRRRLQRRRWSETSTSPTTSTSRRNGSTRRSPGAAHRSPGPSSGPSPRRYAGGVERSSPTTPPAPPTARSRQREPAHQTGQALRARLPQRRQLQAQDPPRRRRLTTARDSTRHEHPTPPSQVGRAEPVWWAPSSRRFRGGGRSRRRGRWRQPRCCHLATLSTGSGR